MLLFGADEQNKLYVTNLFKQKMIIKKTLQKAGERCILCEVLDSLACWLHVQVPPPHTQYEKYLKQSRSFVLCRCVCCTRILSCDFSFSEVYHHPIRAHPSIQNSESSKMTFDLDNSEHFLHSSSCLFVRSSP